jgi:hypothetical protein
MIGQIIGIAEFRYEFRRFVGRRAYINEVSRGEYDDESLGKVNVIVEVL